MAKALTTKQIENLKPGQARREVPDGLLPSLYFVLQPSGKASWAVRYRAAGKPRKLTLGQYPAIDLKIARELARAALAKVASGADPGAEKKAAKAIVHAPVNDEIVAVVARFISQYCKRNLRPLSARETERVLQKEIVAPWRGRRLAQITRGDIHHVLDSIVGRDAPIQANRVLAAFKTLCRWAIKRGLIDANPCTGIRAPAAETARDRVLSDDEIRAVYGAAEALDQPYCEFVHLLILTGQRRAEIAGMQWSELAIDAKLWTLPKERAKNGRQHEVPLSDSAVEILRGLPKIAGSDYVFTISGRRPIRGFSVVKGRLDAVLPADMQPWVIHDLRRTFASGMARLGIAIHIVEALLNHRSGTISGVAAIYNRHDHAADKRAAMATWANFISTLVSDQPESNVRHLTKN